MLRDRNDSCGAAPDFHGIPVICFLSNVEKSRGNVKEFLCRAEPRGHEDRVIKEKTRSAASSCAADAATDDIFFEDVIRRLKAPGIPAPVEPRTRIRRVPRVRAKDNSVWGCPIALLGQPHKR
jgi:hypothetical protein